jgi:hypothetical protein
MGHMENAKCSFAGTTDTYVATSISRFGLYGSEYIRNLPRESNIFSLTCVCKWNTYPLSFTTGEVQPNTCYTMGDNDGMDGSYKLIDKCAKSGVVWPANNSTLPKEYLQGYANGWQEAIDASKNDDGSYGAKGCKS